MARPTDEAKVERMDLRFPPSLIRLIDEWRRVQPEIPGRAEAIRRLVMLGMRSSDIMDNLDDDTLRAAGCTEGEILGLRNRLRLKITKNTLEKPFVRPDDPSQDAYAGIAQARPKNLVVNNRAARRAKKAATKP